MSWCLPGLLGWWFAGCSVLYGCCFDGWWFAVGCCMVCVCYGCTGGLRDFGVDFGVLTFRVCGWVWVRWFTLFGFEFVGLLNL